MGIPCVASDLEGPAEVLQNGGKGVLFVPKDEKDLAKKLRNVIENHADYKATAIANVAYVSNEYAIGIMCDRLENLAIK